MNYNKLVFLFFLFFSNLSYSDNKNKQLLITDPKKIEPFLVTDLNDEENLISKTENKVLVINFWATWCPPCIKEIPHLLKLKQRFENQLEVYFVSVDFNVKKSVPKFLKKNKLENIDVFNDEKLLLSKKFSVSIMPTTIVINKNFEIVAKVTGYVDWLDDDYTNLIKNLL